MIGIQTDINEKKQLDDHWTGNEKKTPRQVCEQLLWDTSKLRQQRKIKDDNRKMNFPGLGDPNSINFVALDDGAQAVRSIDATLGANNMLFTWKPKKTGSSCKISDAEGD